MARLGTFLLKRVFRTVFALYVIATSVFLMFRIAPGDPTGYLIASHFSERARQNVLERFGLARPLHEQYIIYMQNLLVGDFGISFTQRVPVFEVIFPKLLNTLVLTIPAMLLILLVSYHLGSLLGWFRGTRVEEVASMIIMTFRSLPHFVLGLLLLIFFSYWLGLFPIGGMQAVLGEQKTLLQNVLSPEFYRYYALPFVSIFVYFLTLPTLLMRGNVINQRQQSYIELHRLKGLPDDAIRRHAARNSMLPLVTYASTLAGHAFGGVILIEVVFNWPGIGLALVDAVRANDYPLAQGAFILIAFIVLVLNLVIDILYSYIDPRIQLGGEG